MLGWVASEPIWALALSALLRHALTVPAARCATIVVLEESAAAQELIERALRESGHRALITNNLLEVVELTRRVRVDLLVGDLFLLGRNRSLVDQIHRSQQDLRILYVSGKVKDGTSTLQTPFSLQQLTDAVSAALNAESPGL